MEQLIILKVDSLLIGMPGISYSSLTLDLNGIVEDKKHYGMTRIADSRVRPNFPRLKRGTIDENWRMFSAISLEDLAVIQKCYEQRYGNSIGSILPGWIGPNIVFKGINRFSKLPVGTTLEFKSGPLLEITAENTSCATPGKLIARNLKLPQHEASLFVVFAKGYRGVVGKIKKAGIIYSGAEVIVRTPVPFS